MLSFRAFITAFALILSFPWTSTIYWKWALVVHICGSWEQLELSWLRLQGSVEISICPNDLR